MQDNHLACHLFFSFQTLLNFYKNASYVRLLSERQYIALNNFTDIGQ